MSYSHHGLPLMRRLKKNGCVAGEKGELIFADENVEKMEIVMKNYEKDGKTAHDVALCAGEEK